MENLRLMVSGSYSWLWALHASRLCSIAVRRRIGSRADSLFSFSQSHLWPSLPQYSGSGASGSGGGDPSACRPELRHRELLLFPFWICSFRLDRVDSADVAESLWLHCNGRRAGSWSRRICDRGSSTAGGEDSPESWDQADDFHRIHHLCVRHVALR